MEFPQYTKSRLGRARDLNPPMDLPTIRKQKGSMALGGDLNRVDDDEEVYHT